MQKLLLLRSINISPADGDRAFYGVTSFSLQLGCMNPSSHIKARGCWNEKSGEIGLLGQSRTEFRSRLVSVHVAIIKKMKELRAGNFFCF